ncbi:sodium-independent anion transporter [Zobellella denitrificans]|uniref:SulP family inorganic anion transporter n=1 Tax=Zobellella denitrificans TaxID=347534 RepID=UPI000B8BC382|nr:sulfate permease [Zobellella denitrificans]OXS15392.1 sodium-independent anion transporter [Zobellella denitrificans]
MSLHLLGWCRHYDKPTLAQDLGAALIVTLMLIPQSLAYAMLAGLPPEAGLYASILPLVAYGLFGSSRTLSVGPVAVLSLMTASTLGQLQLEGVHYLNGALALALMSGGWLLLFGLLRLGFVAHFISHPVMSGFISASALLITLSQLGPLLGVRLEGHQLQALGSLVRQWDAITLATVVISVASLTLLLWSRYRLKGMLLRLGVDEGLAASLVRLTPALLVMVAMLLSWGLDLGALGVALVGEVPSGLPAWSWPQWSALPWQALIVPSLLLSLVGFVESVSVGQTLAAKRRQRISANQELIGLGVSNIAAGLSGGMPVTGGFARSVVNFDAGAQTPAAGIYTAVGIALAGLWLAPWLGVLPKAVLAATIVVAVLGLLDWRQFLHTWHYSRTDFVALGLTFLVTLAVNVELGLLAGIAASLLLHLYHSYKPHWAEVGLIAGTEHFRNRLRHQVELDQSLLCLRVDESLYFANAGQLEDIVATLVSLRPEVRHLVLQCSAVNRIDASALDSLQMINDRLQLAGIGFHLAEVKGPVMDRLRQSSFLDRLNGRVFLTMYQAWNGLTTQPEYVI